VSTKDRQGDEDSGRSVVKESTVNQTGIVCSRKRVGQRYLPQKALRVNGGVGAG